MYIHINHLCFIPERVAEVSQNFLQDAHVLPKLFSYEKYCRRDNPLAAFYDVHEEKERRFPLILSRAPHDKRLKIKKD
jgi:hypothetical protein